MAENGIRHIRSSPYHPASNGAAERVVQTIKRALLASKKDKPSLEQALAAFLLQYRNTPHATTGAFPSSLFLQRTLWTRLDLLRPHVGAKVQQRQEEQKIYYDQHSRERLFIIGQKVWVHNYREGPRWVKGTVTETLGPVSFVIWTEGGMFWKRHIDQMRARNDETSVDAVLSDLVQESEQIAYFPLPTTN